MEKKEYSDWLSQYTDSDKCLNAFFNQKQFFRINNLKISNAFFLSRTELPNNTTNFDSIYELTKPLEIGKTWEYFLGLIHPQSLPSALVSIALAPNENDTVLDLCASPGSKFSHLAMLMKNQSVLVGNDLKEEKISALYATINRLNVLNSIITRGDAARVNYKNKFTKVLLDAPCSALGSGFAASGRWTQSVSIHLSLLQKRMILRAFDSLKTGGELVYSTCTYAKEENEEVVKYLLENRPFAKLTNPNIDISHDSGLSDYGAEFSNCYRIYSHQSQSEGFFISKIKRTD